VVVVSGNAGMDFSLHVKTVEKLKSAATSLLLKQLVLAVGSEKIHGLVSSWKLP
jgi:hypothetical protein